MLERKLEAEATGQEGGEAKSRELKAALATACRILSMEGYQDMTLGHVSARQPGGSTFWMKPSGFGLDEISAEMLIRVDLDGKKLEGQGRRHIEVFIHSEIYRRRADVNAVVHGHPVYATIFGSTDVPLRPLMHEGAYFTPQVPRFDLTSDLIMNPEQGRAVAEALGSYAALFMRNHGVVVVGPSVEEACLAAVFLERAAQTQLVATAAGPYSWATPQDTQAKRDHIYRNPQLMKDFWDYYCRKLERLNPKIKENGEKDL